MDFALWILLFIFGIDQAVVQGASPPRSTNTVSLKQQPVEETDSDDEIGGSIPVIDLSMVDEEKLAHEIAEACSTYGFFQVTSHGIPQELIEEFRKQCKLYFDLDKSIKYRWKRHASNSRGYFDDEFTKQKLDWKEALDVGVPGSRDWSMRDDNDQNACLDGWNQFPPPEILPDFRRTVVEYFEACAHLSDRLAMLMAKGLNGNNSERVVHDLRENHSSYLRMNYYPTKQESEDASSVLGISPHKDAGFLTVLLQDDDCHSLQVLAKNGIDWMNARPLPGALTINTGDMAQIWSNGQYKAPLHRVRTNPKKKRYSAPFFYNPGYAAVLSPAVATPNLGVYHDCLWGYFRAVRFAGDLTDFGTEIQIEDYEKTKTPVSPHLARQDSFLEADGCEQPFSTKMYQMLLSKHPN